jgi:branched-chain amino acid transport system ATP-binding protein
LKSEPHAWYGAAHILHRVSLAVGRGEVVALMGRNGAGKSTTLKSIAALVPRREGNSLHGRGDGEKGLAPDRAARPGLCARGPPHLHRADGAGEPEVGKQKPRRWPDGQAVPHWTPEKLFALFPNLGEMPERLGGRMSGGEQQMLSVARTLMGQPCLVLLDEPSEGLLR